MALALLAWPEMDIRPFQKGLCGTENIPWFLSRFRKDKKKFERIAASRGISFFDSAEVAKFCYQLDELPRGVRATDLELLLFRFKFFGSIRSGRLDEAFGAVLSAIRCWYYSYNRPESRALDRNQCPKGEVCKGLFHDRVLLQLLLGNTAECALNLFGWEN